MKRKKKVVVVGGGTAGMQAAMRARKRGHEVILFESVGMNGQTRIPLFPLGRDVNRRPFAHLPVAIRYEGVDVRLGIQADLRTILAEHPDQVIVSTTAMPMHLSVPGLEYAISAEEVLKGELPPPGEVLVVGGEERGVETADYLAEHGWRVTLVEARNRLARDMDPVARKLMLARLTEWDVTLRTRCRVKGIRKGVAYLEYGGREETAGPFDLVVATMDEGSLKDLHTRLRAEGVALKVVGDAAREAVARNSRKNGWGVQRAG